ncbi:DUF3313 domain-containing protein [Falsiroseomonas sp. HC035]|uniref:DUF3313 domain-containing protein n=1 Tax=Falsiroseomonas sp. HC035 TaxID=3390999 RepID=UPI003D30F877
MKTSLVAAVSAMALISACSSTQQAAAPPQPSGFLSRETVALLRPSDTGSRLYINPNIDLRRYNKVIIEPVQLWLVPENSKLTEEQRKVVANAFYAALREHLGRDLQIVERPGPGTMVISTAIREVREGGNPVLSTISTFMPPARLAREGANLMTGSDPMVGGAAGEMAVTDSETGQLLAAAVDSRDATAGARVRTSRWDDVQSVVRFWAAQTAFRVCRVQQRPNCQAPS